jgi:formylglycine-generating enzyme required for sulfatase activity
VPSPDPGVCGPEHVEGAAESSGNPAMAHDVFISYSSHDKPIADAICAGLEAAKIRCWIAPRDVLPGVPYGEALSEALRASQVLVLVFSSNSNCSGQVMREVESAVDKGIPILPFRIEDVQPSASLDYFVKSIHWLEAITPPLEKHLQTLAGTVRSLLKRHHVDAVAPAPPATPHADLKPHPRAISLGKWVLAGVGLMAAGVTVLLALVAWWQTPSDRLDLASAGPRDSKGETGKSTADTTSAPTKKPASKSTGDPIKAQTKGPSTAQESPKNPAMPAPPPLDLGGGVTVPFVRVPKGTFWMGWDSEKKESKEVTIATDFELGACTVTQEQWQALMLDNPSSFSRDGKSKDKVAKVSDADLRRFPVESVSWDDVQVFLTKLNAREKGKGWLYRLPKEVEWEYACRNAATTKAECSFDFYFDRGTNDLSSHQANFKGDSPAGNAAKGPYLKLPTKVGSYAPNKLGLYDMHGNLCQWCEDRWDGPPPSRVLRGAGWNGIGWYSRVANRRGLAPSERRGNVGFRLARVPSGSK